MKVFLTAIALASAFANNSEAQVVRPVPAQSWQQPTVPADQAFAQQGRRVHSTNPAYDVYDTQNRYVGSDPDATVRSMMALDPTGSD
jgi:hypothetical protein